jgi:cell wall-associated NlpC family hydrolase
LLLPALAISAATGGISVATPSAPAVANIPPTYLALYEQAGMAYGLPWQLLAGVGKVECDHGQNPDPACSQEGAVNSAGAGGPMQFLAGTWAEYGLDANGDGKADRWDHADAIFAAANFLKANGAPGDSAAALYMYNHSQSYVAQVLAWASLYTSDGSATAAVSDAGASSAARAAVAYVLGQLGTPYQWGGDGPGGFDCSGLVQAAYASAGIELPRVAQAQYDATAKDAVAAGQPLEPGDLVFFGASPAAVEHVGIVVSAGEMVDAPHSGAVVRIEPYAWPDYVGATRPAGGNR